MIFGGVDDPSLRVLTLSVVQSRQGRPLRLEAHPTIMPGQLIRLENCKEKAIAEGWAGLLTLNPANGQLLDALCTLPADTLTLSFATCNGTDSVDGLMCKDGAEQLSSILWLDPAQGDLAENFDQPLDLVLMADLLGGQPALPDAARTLTDQIIEAYLTIFWDQPLPAGLESYLQMHPAIPRTTKAPSHQQLVNAAARQPHLTRIYPVRQKVGEAVLEDMFRFLTEMRLIETGSR